jgi:hypothetical protein
MEQQAPVPPAQTTGDLWVKVAGPEGIPEGSRLRFGLAVASHAYNTRKSSDHLS